MFVTHPLLFLQSFLHHFGGVTHTAQVGLSHTGTLGLSHTVFGAQKGHREENKKRGCVSIDTASLDGREDQTRTGDHTPPRRVR